jgi:hypothetical protein
MASCQSGLSRTPCQTVSESLSVRTAIFPCAPHGQAAAGAEKRTGQHRSPGRIRGKQLSVRSLLRPQRFPPRSPNRRRKGRQHPLAASSVGPPKSSLHEELHVSGAGWMSMRGVAKPRLNTYRTQTIFILLQTVCCSFSVRGRGDSRKTDSNNNSLGRTVETFPE